MSVVKLLCILCSFVMAAVAMSESIKDKPNWARAAYFMALAVWLLP